MQRFGPATRAYFAGAFPAPTAVQRQGWPRIAGGEHALLIAPTGSGKTLAAFLWSIDRCIDRCIDRRIDRRIDRPPETGPAGEAEAPGVRVLYVSPLKALVYDVERNLEAPLAGIAAAAERLGMSVRLPRVDVRTGDTSAKARRRQARRPAEILVTTPESLYLMLGSAARATLRTVETVIVDEVHALAGNKRGAHLQLSLERLAELCARDPQRIGLSATARPLAEIARFLGGAGRQVAVVDTSEPPALDLAIVMPDENAPAGAAGRGIAPAAPGAPLQRPGIWPLLQAELLAEIQAHSSTIVFVNSRGQCERLTRELNELGGAEIARSHHGSLSHAERRQVEARLQAGELAAVVATSSLELGIDMQAVDLVILVESPGSVARALQRVGRAGHGVGQVSRGRIYPKHRGDLLEAAVVARAMTGPDGQPGDEPAIEPAIEPTRVPRNPLDVLAQQIVAAVAMDDWQVADLARVCRRAASFQDLPDSALFGVLDMLAGRYPSTEFADLAPRIVWDRERGRLSARRGARMIALMSGGTIPDRGTYGVFLADTGKRVGELDEEMVHETQAGDLFTLGASTWYVQEITRDRVLVSPAPGQVGKLPFWRGEGPGRPFDIGRRMGALTRAIDARLPAGLRASTGAGAASSAGVDPDALADARAWLSASHHLHPRAAEQLARYVAEQRLATDTVPTDQRITIERYRDELGDYRVCILSHFGGRVHAPWALAVQALLTRRAGGREVQIMWTDDGIALRLPDPTHDGLQPGFDWQLLVPPAAEVEDLVISQLDKSALFASHFRENAARALLMPRQRPGKRTPLWVQRMKSRDLLAAARAYPDFPMIIESYRSCLEDALDTPALVELCRAVERRAIHIDLVETRSPSPFARSLVFSYVATYLYEGDAPAAERRATALSLDRSLLRELLGQEDLRALLHADTMAEVEAELQALVPGRRASHADALHDLLRRIGDLTEAELGARVAGDLPAMVRELEAGGRAVRVRVAGRDALIAAEDAALYRDALGVSLPGGLPAELLAARDRPLAQLVTRFARTHGPFTVHELAERFALLPAHLEPVIERERDAGQLVEGGFRPGGQGVELCHADVLARIKRRTLAELRDRAAPVAPEVLARFSPSWHGLITRGRGRLALERAIARLEGLPLSLVELERAILPARVADYQPAMLDELGAIGWLAWVGRGALGSRDGRVALYRRERAAVLLAGARAAGALDDALERGPLHRAILDHLREHGASFFAAVQQACTRVQPDTDMAAVLAALWELVWSGLVTNDTVAPLRAFTRSGTRLPAPSRSRRGRRGHERAALSTATGRWSLVSDLVRDPPSPTECAHAWAETLLERHGVLAAEAARIEDITGGFSAVYPVLAAMEEAGRVRRGYFVSGLGPAQFALPGAVDRLRACASEPDAEPDAGQVTVLAATDPANPYGWLVDWPACPGNAEKAPRRVAGASVVLVGGSPVLYLDAGGRRLLGFPAAHRPRALEAAIRALDRVVETRRGKTLRIETIDDTRAISAVLAPAFLALGYKVEPRGLVRDLD